MGLGERTLDETGGEHSPSSLEGRIESETLIRISIIIKFIGLPTQIFPNKVIKVRLNPKVRPQRKYVLQHWNLCIDVF